MLKCVWINRQTFWYYNQQQCGIRKQKKISFLFFQLNKSCWRCCCCQTSLWFFCFFDLQIRLFFSHISNRERGHLFSISHGVLAYNENCWLCQCLLLNFWWILFTYMKDSRYYINPWQKSLKRGKNREKRQRKGIVINHVSHCTHICYICVKSTGYVEIFFFFFEKKSCYSKVNLTFFLTKIIVFIGENEK